MALHGNTLTALLAWATENIQINMLSEIRTVGDGLSVQFKDGRLGLLYLGEDGTPRMFAPSAV